MRNAPMGAFRVNAGLTRYFFINSANCFVSR